MCGFAGVLHPDGISREYLERMASSIVHRGPDNTGYFQEGSAGFIHNRLSLVDLSTNAHQPFLDERHVLLFNGEIYNHAHLRKSELEGESFRSTSDTETLFLLLRRYGVRRTAGLIRGMFAFSWYDRETGELFLVRDRVGIKPLFYQSAGRAFKFASELKAMVFDGGVRPDKASILSAAIGELEYSRTHTAFEDVLQLEPGFILHRDPASGTTRLEGYFRLTDLVDRAYYKELEGMDERALLDRFDELFSGGVESMLMSDVGMGAFVSGGIDSSLIASVACRGQRIDMYTANVIGKYSELPFSRMLSERIGQPLHVYDFEPGYLIRDLVKTTWHYEAPIVVHGNAIPFQGVARLANQTGTKAVLTGEGSDELFLGYPRLLTRKWDTLIRLPFELTTRLYRRIPGLTRYLNLNGTNYNRDLLYLPFAYERQRQMSEYEEAYSFVSGADARRDHVMTLEMVGRGLHALLWRNDRMGMMHSIESRFPFLDEEVLRFAANLPIRMKIGRSARMHNWKHPFLIDKYIVRKYAERYLPDELNYREKKGFPLFGLLNMEVAKGYFKGGFLQEMLQYGDASTEAMERSTDPYLLAKLACVEVWGRLYMRGEKVEAVQEHATAHLHIRT